MRRFTLITLVIISLSLLPQWAWRPEHVLCSDFFQQQIGFMLETRRMLLGGSLPLWSWNTFTGDSFIADYAFYSCTSPFVWLFTLFPASQLKLYVILTLYLKIFCAGAAARLYLRQRGFGGNILDAGALMYAFSSYTISNLFYWHFMEPMIMFPLLLWGLERFWEKSSRRRFAVLSLLSGAVFFINFYFAVGSFIAALLYSLFRLGGSPGGIRALLVSARAVVLGALLAMPVILTSYLHLSLYSRSHSLNFPFGILNVYEIPKRLLAFFHPKISDGAITEFNSLSYNSVAPWLPFISCLPAALYIYRYRDRLSAFIILLTVLLAVIPLCGLFTLFRDPFYCRWSYALVLMLILATLRYLKRGGTVTPRAALSFAAVSVGFIGLMIILLYLRPGRFIPASEKMQGLSMVILVEVALDLALLYLWARRGSSSSGLLLFTSVMATVSTTAAFTVTCHYDFFSSRKYSIISCERMFGYPQQNADIYMRHRICNVNTDPNFSLLSGQCTHRGYSSVGPGPMLRFYSIIELGEAPYPAVNPSRHLDALTPLLSMKEWVYDTMPLGPDFVAPAHLSRPRACGRLRYYISSLYVPPGFAYDSWVPESAVRPLAVMPGEVNIPALMLSHLVVADEDTAAVAGRLRRGPRSSVELRALFDTSRAIDIDSIARARRAATATDFLGDTRGWSCRTSFAEDKVLFFSVSHDRGFTYYIDGRKTPSIEANLGMTALRVPAGEHEIRAEFMPAGLVEGLWCAAAGAIFVLLLLLLPERKTQ